MPKLRGIVPPALPKKPGSGLAAMRADLARRRAARDLGLPVLETGQVLYPDAQVEYQDEGGDIGRVNIEIATEHYRSGDVAAKGRSWLRRPRLFRPGPPHRHGRTPESRCDGRPGGGL